MRLHLTLITLVASCSLNSRSVMAEDQNNSKPDWIWSTRDRMSGGKAAFSKSFELNQEYLQSQLWVAADFARLTVFLNGHVVTELNAYDAPQDLEVTPLIKLGRNSIRLQAVACDGPTAVALKLVVQRRDAGPVTIVSNSAWLATNKSSHSGQTVDFGQVQELPWLISAASTRINPFDDYTQWKRALGAVNVTQPATFQIEEGFQIAVLRTTEPDEASWVSMAFDPRGRLVVAKEDRGLLRMTLSKDNREITQVEAIDGKLQECRGLLFAFDSLYINANNSKGLYRMRDSDGDDHYDEVKLLYHSPGSVGHGRNDLTLGPDGMIYCIHGDSVDLPTDFVDYTSPFREQRRGSKTAEGHVIRTDREGKTWELLVAGLRNPYGIAFNFDGEMFTYDADAEFDMGSPWYRPTRVNHLVAGGDFGWRGVTGEWPPYFPDHPDNAWPNLDIGKGSPTAVQFGYQSGFPTEFRRALFILDWAYGRILAVHMAPRGASYVCRAKPFLRGRPLNVTDLTFGPDGAMYFVTGGRKTRSGLYRVSYVGQPTGTTDSTLQQEARAQHAKRARTLRHELESLHCAIGPSAVERAWPHLDSPDPWIRHAARVAIEHQPLKDWQEQAFSEKRRLAALTAFMALARSGEVALRSRIVARLVELPLYQLTSQEKKVALYTCTLCDVRSLDERLAGQLAQKLESLYPDRSGVLNRRLSQLLVKLKVPSVVSKTLSRLNLTPNQAEQLHGLYVLRQAEHGWTLPLRRNYFKALNQTQNYLGGKGMLEFLENIRNDAIAGLSEQERQACKPLLESGSYPVAEELPSRPFVREWKFEELASSLDTLGRGRDFERGKRMYAVALCSSCHRLGETGTPLGPDLTSLASRFSRTNLLESILFPSRIIAENYRSRRIVTSEGKVLEGRVINAGDFRTPTLKIVTNPLIATQVTEIEKSDIESHSPSPVSIMPKGLLDTLSMEEILDLLAYIEAAGNPDHLSFQ